MHFDSYVNDIIYNVFQKDYKVKFNYKLDTSAIVKIVYWEINWRIKGINLFEILELIPIYLVCVSNHIRIIYYINLDRSYHYYPIKMFLYKKLILVVM